MQRKYFQNIARDQVTLLVNVTFPQFQCEGKLAITLGSSELCPINFDFLQSE